MIAARALTRKINLKVIPLFCIAHPYCARFFASLAHPEHSRFLMRLSSPEKRMGIYSKGGLLQFFRDTIARAKIISLTQVSVCCLRKHREKSGKTFRDMASMNRTLCTVNNLYHKRI